MKSRLAHYIDARAVQVWRMTWLVVNVILFLAYGSMYYVSKTFRAQFTLQIILLFVLGVFSIFTIVIFPKLRWQRWRYEVHTQEIDLQHGVFITKKTLIPMIRVQHVDVRQGPFLRYYGLATIEISTAATTHAIPAVAWEEAERLRVQLSQLARVATEDV